MEQSKLESFIESCANTLSGFLLSWGLWVFGISEAIKSGYLTLEDGFTVTLIYTVLSAGRTYFWRRFFANKFHMAAHRWVTKFYEITGW